MPALRFQNASNSVYNLREGIDETCQVTSEFLEVTARLSKLLVGCAAKLQSVLDQFKESRPAELDRAFAQTDPENAPKQKKKKK